MNNLLPMKQYPIERDVFCEIFGKIYSDFYDKFYDTTTSSFKVWRYDDEFYILHFESGTIINWYKHLGRCNTCNKNLSIEEYKKLANDLYNELEETEKCLKDMFHINVENDKELDKKETQQKEFIKYLEDEIHSYEAVSDLLFNFNKEMKVYKEILQKYKEILGVLDENN